jgi:hypothetical protein
MVFSQRDGGFARSAAQAQQPQVAQNRMEAAIIVASVQSLTATILMQSPVPRTR